MLASIEEKNGVNPSTFRFQKYPNSEILNSTLPRMSPSQITEDAIAVVGGARVYPLPLLIYRYIFVGEDFLSQQRASRPRANSAVYPEVNWELNIHKEVRMRHNAEHLRFRDSS